MHLEVRPHARTPGLRGEHQIVVLADLARLRDDAVEQELVILAVHHEHRGAHDHRVAGSLTRSRLPAAGERAAQLLDLLRILVRGRARQTHLLPVERRGELRIARHEARRLGIVEVGNDEHGRRMLEEAVRQFLKPQPYILEADFLGDHEHRHGWKLPMRAPHDAPDDGAVTHAGVEHAYRRRRRPQQCHLVRRAPRDGGLLIAGRDESQVLLAVVIEAKGGRRVRRAGGTSRR